MQDMPHRWRRVKLRLARIMCMASSLRPVSQHFQTKARRQLSLPIRGLLLQHWYALQVLRNSNLDEFMFIKWWHFCTGISKTLRANNLRLVVQIEKYVHDTYKYCKLEILSTGQTYFEILQALWQASLGQQLLPDSCQFVSKGKD